MRWRRHQFLWRRSDRLRRWSGRMSAGFPPALFFPSLMLPAGVLLPPVPMRMLARRPVRRRSPGYSVPFRRVRLGAQAASGILTRSVGTAFGALTVGALVPAALSLAALAAGGSTVPALAASVPISVSIAIAPAVAAAARVTTRHHLSKSRGTKALKACLTSYDLQTGRNKSALIPNLGGSLRIRFEGPM